ncbi:stage II sporulation protein M [Candidatus Woesearchaeota archaeon]|nr:stage II sporulation protein M [Candidatus Woesearchaeota archaeon]
MVLEHIFPEDWLEKKAMYAFILGAAYSIFAIAMAKILFPADPALVAVAFTSLLLLPELYKLFSIEEQIEDQEKKFSFRELFKDNRDFVKTYVFLAFGIFLVYTLAAMFLPSMQVNQLFREQLELRGASGNAIFQMSLFWDILRNNWWVLVACFLVSLLSGDGAIFLITWNASLWGTIFGITAKNAALFARVNPLWYLFVVLFIVFPHAFLEMMAYILGAISGGVISKDVLLESFDSERFWEVFKYNFMLFLVSLVFLLLGAIVETYVLGNSNTYQNIIVQSYMYGR